MRVTLALPFVVLAFALAVPTVAAEPVFECQQYPIGVEEACHAARPTAEPLYAWAMEKAADPVGCAYGAEPPVGWLNCVPGMREPPLPTENCRNPTWDRCFDDLRSELPQ